MGETGCGVEAERAYRGFCLDMPARARVIIGWPMTGAGAIDGDELPDEGRAGEFGKGGDDGSDDGGEEELAGDGAGCGTD